MLLAKMEALVAGGFVEVLIKGLQMFFFYAALLQQGAHLVLVQDQGLRRVLVFFQHLI